MEEERGFKLEFILIPRGDNYKSNKPQWLILHFFLIITLKSPKKKKKNQMWIKGLPIIKPTSRCESIILSFQ
jgi:hypothetical protein